MCSPDPETIIQQAIKLKDKQSFITYLSLLLVEQEDTPDDPELCSDSSD